MSKSIIKSTSKDLTLITLLRQRVIDDPNRKIYSYLLDGGNEKFYLTYKELDQKARAIAAMLQNMHVTGERALLLYSPGLEFISAFLGCLYAGVVAIPGYSPRRNRPDSRLQSIVTDAQAKIALTDQVTYLDLERRIEYMPEMRSLHWVNTDQLSLNLSSEWKETQIPSETLAFLQYTSGSTTMPRGVMVNHRNIMANLELIHNATRTSSEKVGMSWLPFYHDMGLMTGVLLPLYDNFPMAFLSPFDFIQNPLLWLQTISSVKATHSGGPNFSYELCINKIRPEDCSGIDLSSWEVAFNGAEPVRAETLTRFSQIFKPLGFRGEAFLPCYGLAESTVGVSWSSYTSYPKICTLNRNALGQKKVIEVSGSNLNTQQLVGCGKVPSGQKIIIVNPDLFLQCPSNQIGEIWVSGPSVTQGYWNHPDETTSSFNVFLSDNNEGPFLRTGDEGFLKNGELFVTGRLKDLIIIRGQNFYPQDIERTVELSHSSLCPGSGAAFSINVNGEESLVIIQEVERQFQFSNRNEIFTAIMEAVTENFDLRVSAITLIKYGSIPKTTSGKVQRFVCRERFISNNLKVQAEWRDDFNLGESEKPTRIDKQIALIRKTVDDFVGFSEDTIQAWLKTNISVRLKISPDKIDINKPFSYYGLDSMAVVSISSELEKWIGFRLSPILLYEYPTIQRIASFLANKEVVENKSPKKAETKFVNSDPIAIIGIGCRFPGNANNPESFWNLLKNGVDAIKEVPEERWGKLEFYNPNPSIPGKMNTKWGGFLEHVDQFDPHFFGISPREATRMDPQQRLLLEVAWEALEDSGNSPTHLEGTRTGVFIGITSNDYGQLQMGNSNLIDAYTATGNAFSIAANRISYYFDLKGPSVAVDTACSSSLLSTYLACCSLWRGETDLALAGGVNLILSPAITINFTKAGAMSPEGRIKAFDSRADGYVRSEGCGIVILKPLSKALADCDPIYAVIRGGAVNQDGHTNGIMAPNQQSQEAVIIEAYQNSGISPKQVQYVETHGSGTLLGDPIEANALGKVISIDRSKDSFVSIGSVKTNIGHLEAAAGIAGLIKVALSLKHRMIPPSLNYLAPNPLISFDELHLKVQQSLTEWPQDPDTAFAGVSSFGFGGTNVHLVLEGVVEKKAKQKKPNDSNRDSVYLLPISAHSSDALQSLACEYKDFWSNESQESETSLHDICYSASVRRNHHKHRIALVLHSKNEIHKSLETFFAKGSYQGLSIGKTTNDSQSKIVFVFSGQGSQWLKMGQELFEDEPFFRSKIEQCDQIMRQFVSWSLVDLINNVGPEKQLDEIDIVQPMIFAIQVSLAELWRYWGIIPDAIIGHSMGEIAAAYVAGGLGIEDAIRIICQRSKQLRKISGLGSMAVLELPIDKVEKYLFDYKNKLSIASSNSINSTVISGDTYSMQQLMSNLQSQDIFCKLIKVDVASHSSQVDCLLDDLKKDLECIKPQNSTIPFYSTVTGEVSNGTDLDSQYWVRNLRQPVLFSSEIQELFEKDHDIFLEISPHPILLSSIQQDLNHFNRKGTVLPSLKRGESEKLAMFKTLGELYSLGFSINWRHLYSDETQNQSTILPSYPWKRERYWFEAEGKDSWNNFGANYLSRESHPFLGRQIESALIPRENIWETKFDKDNFPFIKDHCIGNVPLLPGTVFIEMVLAALKVLKNENFTIKEVSFPKVLFFSDNVIPTIQLNISPDESGELAFHFYSRSTNDKSYDGKWNLNANGKIHENNDSEQGGNLLTLDIHKIIGRCCEIITKQEYYQKLGQMDLQFGPYFQGIEHIWRQDGEALGQVQVPEMLDFEKDIYIFHPAILGTCLQIVGAALPNEINSDLQTSFLPIFIKEFRVFKKPSSKLWCHATIKLNKSQKKDNFEGDISIFNDSGDIAAEIIGLRLQPLENITRRITENLNDSFYEVKWKANELFLENDSRPSPKVNSKMWIIFSDNKGIGKELANIITYQGGKSILVYPGCSFECVSQDYFQIRPEQGNDINLLLKMCLGEDRSTPINVIHLWSLDSTPTESSTIESIEADQVLGCESVLHLVQGIMHEGQSGSCRLWLVTQGAQPVNKTNIALSVAQAPLWGFGRTIAQEHHNIWGGLVDLDPCASFQELSTMLFTEFLNSNNEDQVAFREGKRYVARLSQKKEITECPSFQCRTNGSYLITGAFGELGLQVARWMVRQGARRLILLGHSKLPPRKKWGQVKDENQRKQITTIKELEAIGTSVHIVSMDIANDKELSLFLDTFSRESWPPIRGVVHAAGLVDLKPVLELNAMELHKILSPKISGSWLLHQLLKETQLDFFVLFSSVSTILSSPMLGGYAAANSFLDVLAHYRQSQDLPALSIDWGPWAEIGMAAKYQRQGNRAFVTRGMGSIGTDQGLDTLGRLIQQNSPQIVVVPINWQEWFQFHSDGSKYPFLSELVQINGNTNSQSRENERNNLLTRNQLMAASPNDQQRLLIVYLNERVSKVLGIPLSQIEINQPLNDFGLDSLMAIEMKNHIEVNLKLNVPLVSFLNAPSITQLAIQLQNQFISSIPVDSTIEKERIPNDLTKKIDSKEAKDILANLNNLSENDVNELLNNISNEDKADDE